MPKYVDIVELTSKHRECAFLIGAISTAEKSVNLRYLLELVEEFQETVLGVHIPLSKCKCVKLPVTIWKYSPPDVGWYGLILTLTSMWLGNSW